jgi:head-tail adaptor
MIPGPKTQLICQRVTEISDGLGGMTQSWSNLATLSGVLTASSGVTAKFAGRERLLADRTTVTSSLIFYCDYPTGITITEKDRFVSGTRTFEILFVYNPANSNHHLEISLFEVK